MASGIYQILNKENGKRYIGSAVDFNARRRSHKHHLNKGKHTAKRMQHTWNRDGESIFEFELLITCPKSLLIHYEQQFIDQLKPEYNTCKIAGNTLGVKHTDEFRRKCSDRMKNLPEHIKEILRTAAKGNTHRRGMKATPELREKLRLAHIGKKQSAETIKKRSTTLKALHRTLTPEQKEKLRQTALGNTYWKNRKHTPETLAKIGAAHKGKTVSIETREKMKIARNRRPPASDETKRRMSESQTRRYSKCTAPD